MVLGTAGVVLADNEGAGYGTSEYSFSANRSRPWSSHTREKIREPVETGALPDRSVMPDREGWVNMDPAEQERTPELRGLPNIQSGGGGG